MKKLRTQIRRFDAWFDETFGWFISPKKYYED